MMDYRQLTDLYRRLAIVRSAVAHCIADELVRGQLSRARDLTYWRKVYAKAWHDEAFAFVLGDALLIAEHGRTVARANDAGS